MQFLLVAYDATDDDALSRRMAAREAHLALVEKNKEAGHAKFGAALMDGDKMVGSMMVLEYPTRKALEAWLNEEPYITQNVWDDVSINECKIAPSFVKS
jgi:uncharacterized protein